MPDEASAASAASLLSSDSGNKSGKSAREVEQAAVIEAVALLHDEAVFARDRHRWGTRGHRDLEREADAWDRRLWTLRMCQQSVPFRLRCVHGHGFELRAIRCGYRFCPFCRATDRGRKRASLERKFERWRSRLRLCTLTVRNRSAGELQAALDELLRAWAKLQGDPVWSDHVRGGVAVVEVTASAGRGWHPHLHVVWDGELVNQRLLWEAWSRALGYQAAMPDLRAKVPYNGQDRKAGGRGMAGYLAHYASKGVEVRLTDQAGELVRGATGKPIEGGLHDLPPAMLAEWVRVWWRLRTVRPFGCHLGLPESEEPREPWDGKLRCPFCGAEPTQCRETERAYAWLDEQREWHRRLAMRRRWNRIAADRKLGLEPVPF